jgi:nitroimidazol reductase NimA-like FMN-containing flavoprotein (pyridoxamine 5'-phosphate oxidase superfamily)
MADSYGTVEVLDHARCVALLATVHIGRVVFTSRAMPAVRPVRFAVRDDAVWFRMPVGDLWPAGVLDTVVAIAVDDLTPDLDAGWFVTVLGRASEVRDRHLVDEIATLLPAAPDEDRYVRVLVESISGRRIQPAGTRCAVDRG